MPTSHGLHDGDREILAELAPVLQRAVGLDPASLVRLRIGDRRAAAVVLLPFAVLVSRAVEATRATSLDVAVAAGEALAWLDGRSPVPASRDHEWRTGLPPDSGWRRLETVPDSVIRPLVRQGALALRDTPAAGGPAARAADALLDSVVLTITADRDADGGADCGAEVTLRMLSALTRMGFLRKDGHVHVDVTTRWTRVVGEFGTVYREQPGTGLLLR